MTRNLLLTTVLALLVWTPSADAAQMIPLPGTPGSSIPSSATPSTSVPSQAPAAAPAPTLSSPSPSGTPMQMMPAPNVSNNAFAPANTTSNIDSFFQVPKQLLPPLDKAQLPKEVSIDANKQAECHDGFKLRRFFYHVLDNAGVPVPVRKDADLDPSITAPSSQLSVDVKRLERIVPPSENGTVTPCQPAIKKIPESELEGVELPAPKDVPPKDVPQ